ncbi:hypothetical protein [Leifsonia shinshuensis]|uniref:Uncharacterized protein n=1 Tax=Leifsonia shinshuensis TaxID=150026 RepID=A0A853CVZ6_9MICO|nr:hypothetical protein [Leifsonia shinshuensis]NYJ24449.1 hypothetical protein [Leifsonia shinshuensis]
MVERIGALLDQLIDRGVNQELNAWGAAHGLPPLAWQMSLADDVTIEGTDPNGRAAPGAGEFCARWADLLELPEMDPFGPNEGLISWRGPTDDGKTIEIYAITDVELYNSAYPDDLV